MVDTSSVRQTTLLVTDACVAATAEERFETETEMPAFTTAIDAARPCVAVAMDAVRVEEVAIRAEATAATPVERRRSPATTAVDSDTAVDVREDDISSMLLASAVAKLIVAPAIADDSESERVLAAVATLAVVATIADDRV
jgi:hypothetical protein